MYKHGELNKELEQYYRVVNDVFNYSFILETVKK